MVFWLDKETDKSRENTNKWEVFKGNNASGDIKNVAIDDNGMMIAGRRAVVNDPLRPVGQDGTLFTPPPRKIRKQYAKQEDRFLKQIPVHERRKQMMMRRAIAEEIDDA